MEGRLNTSSKLIYSLAGIVFCMSIFFINRGWWALTAILAVSASPVFEPNKWNVVLSICTVVSIGAFGFNLISGTAGAILSAIAVISASLSMVIGFFRYYLRRVARPS